jgi:predicted amidohydrolase YtcJ
MTAQTAMRTADTGDIDAQGRLAIPPFVEPHIHLDATPHRGLGGHAANDAVLQLKGKQRLLAAQVGVNNFPQFHLNASVALVIWRLSQNHLQDQP